MLPEGSTAAALAISSPEVPHCDTQARPPADVYWARNTSLRPAFEPPGMFPVVEPARYALPEPSTAMPYATSSPAVPSWRLYTKTPFVSYLLIQASIPPWLVKPREPVVEPPTITFPVESTATALAMSSPGVPISFVQRSVPDALYLARNASFRPELVVPAPRLPVVCPATKTLPEASTATARPQSFPALPS